MPRSPVLVAALFACTLAPAIARAHIHMTYPEPRSTAQKEGPCGATGSPRGATVAVFEPGETISLRWDETVDHNAHYRIAFDVDGHDDFVAPAGRDDLYNSPAVLADGIEDNVGGSYSFSITLPDVECERCTIQLIQVMYGSGNYFQCADIAIRRTGSGVGPTDGGAGMRDGGGATRDGGADVGADAGSGAPRGDGGISNGDAMVTAPSGPGTRGPGAEGSSGGIIRGSCSVLPGRRPARGPALLAVAGLFVVAGALRRVRSRARRSRARRSRA